MLDISIINPYIRVAMHSVIPANHEIKRRIIFDYELIYIEDGECILTYNGIDYKIEKGNFILLRPDVTHSFWNVEKDLSQPHIHFDITHTENSPIVTVSFKDTNALTDEERHLIRDDLFADYPQTPLVFFSEKERILKNFYDIINMSDAAMLSRKAKLIQIIEALISDNFTGLFNLKHSSRLIEEQVKDYIDAGQGSAAKLDDISKQFSYSKYYLDRRFKERYGLGIIAYRNEKRMQRAKELLKTEAVSAVSEQLGFSSIYAFSRAFKSRFGFPPTDAKKAK